jgi:hypothetical protein
MSSMVVFGIASGHSQLLPDLQQGTMKQVFHENLHAEDARHPLGS